MATVTLFLDEAGYTGPDLINRHQPFFTFLLWRARTSARETHAHF